MKQYKSRDKITQKMTRDGLIEVNETQQTAERISKREQDADFQKSPEQQTTQDGTQLQGLPSQTSPLPHAPGAAPARDTATADRVMEHIEAAQTRKSSKKAVRKAQEEATALALGSVPIAPYATPSTDEVPDAITPYLQEHDAILLKNHGAVTVGADVYTAYYRMETLEQFAKITLTAHLLGGAKEIDRENIDRLVDLRNNYYKMSGKHPGYKKYSGESHFASKNREDCR